MAKPVEFFSERKIIRFIINEFNQHDLDFLNIQSNLIYSIPIKNNQEYCNCFVIELDGLKEKYDSEPEIIREISSGLIQAIWDSIFSKFDEVEFII